MMKYRAASKTQRTRHHLSQQAVQRAHRRCDLIRIAPERELPVSSLTSPNDKEQNSNPVVISSPTEQPATVSSNSKIYTLS